MLIPVKHLRTWLLVFQILPHSRIVSGLRPCHITFVMLASMALNSIPSCWCEGNCLKTCKYGSRYGINSLLLDFIEVSSYTLQQNLKRGKRESDHIGLFNEISFISVK